MTVKSDIAPEHTSMDVMAELKEWGYEKSFTFHDGKMLCAGDEREYQSDELILCGTFRFEGASDPDDSRIIYALEVRDTGARGFFMDAFGAYGDIRASNFIQQVEDKSAEYKLQTDLPLAPL